jgi:ribosomal-protein-serine acetyltransferase
VRVEDLRIGIDEDTELRLLQEGDADTVFATVDADREHMREFLDWVDDNRRVEDTLAFISKAQAEARKGRAFHMALHHRGHLVGIVSLHNIDNNHRTAEIGYWLGRPYQGRGLMTRACAAMLDHAYGALGLNRIQVRSVSANAKSLAIPERLGFSHEGTIRESWRTGTRFHDIELYGLLRSEWRASGEERGQ